MAAASCPSPSLLELLEEVRGASLETPELVARLGVLLGEHLTEENVNTLGQTLRDLSIDPEALVPLLLHQESLLEAAHLPALVGQLCLDPLRDRMILDHLLTYDFLGLVKEKAPRHTPPLEACLLQAALETHDYYMAFLLAMLECQEATLLTLLPAVFRSALPSGWTEDDRQEDILELRAKHPAVFTPEILAQASLGVML